MVGSIGRAVRRAVPGAPGAGPHRLGRSSENKSFVELLVVIIVGVELVVLVVGVVKILVLIVEVGVVVLIVEVVLAADGIQK